MAVWIYAGIRPLNGAGVKTAIYTGLALCDAAVLNDIGPHRQPRLCVYGIACGLVD